jgi:tetratricopeptide (TPR) repeat protein
MTGMGSRPPSGMLLRGVSLSLLLYGCAGKGEPPATPPASPPSPVSGQPSTSTAGAEVRLQLPPEAAQWVNQGVGEYRQGRYHDAAASFEKARDLVPADPRVSNLLGTALLQSKTYAPARAEFQRMLALMPEALEPRLGLARIDIRLGEFEEATRFLREVLARDPRNAQSLFNLGQIRYRAGDYAEARDLLGRLLQQIPNHPEAHYTLGLTFMRLGEDASAGEEFSRTIALSPDNSQAHFNLAKVYLRMGRASDAGREQKIFERLWDRQAADRNAEGTARDLFLAGDYAASLKEYVHLLEISPGNGRYELGRAQCFLKMGRRDEALAALEKAVALDPKLPDAHYHLAVLYQELGEEAKSQKERQAFDELEAIGENKTGF